MLSSPDRPSPLKARCVSPTCKPPLRVRFVLHPPGSYLSGVHFGVFRRCTTAQTVQKHQEQREQRSSAAKAAASAAWPSECAPVAAHALRQPAGSRALHAGLARWPAPRPRTRLGNLRRSLAPGPAGSRRTSGSRCLREQLRSPLQIPKPGEKRAEQVGARGDSPAGEGDRPSCTPQSLAASARCALAPAPESKHNSRAFVWLSAPAARSRGSPCAPCSLCPCPRSPALPRARASLWRLH